MREPAGVWRTALSSRLRTSLCSSSGLPCTVIDLPLSMPRWCSAAHRGDLGGGVAGDLRQIAEGAARFCGRRRLWPAAAGRRPACSSAARSAAPSRPSPDPPPARDAPAKIAAARGWRARWSTGCAARARRRRRTRAACASPARAPRERSPASATSAPAFGPARRPRPRPWARASAGTGHVSRRSPERSRSAKRSAAWRDRRSPVRRGWREAFPPSTPAAMNSQRRSIVDSMSSLLRPYWT